MADQNRGAQSDPRRKPFTPETLDGSTVAVPLLRRMQEKPDALHDLVIDLNLAFERGRDGARALTRQWLDEIEPGSVDALKGRDVRQYVFARMSSEGVRALARRNVEATRPGEHGGAFAPVHRIWLDHTLRRLTTASLGTIKADAARKTYDADGENVVWAVADSGIDGSHPHFHTWKTLELQPPLQHRDFTVISGESESDLRTAEQRALRDEAGHGTHVAGILAGEHRATEGSPIVAEVRRRSESGDIEYRTVDDIPHISGVAPKAKLLSLKVLDAAGEGLSSNLLAAIAYVQELNGYGRHLLVHGLNLSVGYEFDPEWFACGQSPLCVEVDRLVNSGVCVVVAAGNSGYGWVDSKDQSGTTAGLDLTINDPGNAELAITVGSTHRDQPKTYGVSYFSSKGPTGDGRLKPDLVAPGEKIISCLSSQAQNEEDLEAPDPGVEAGRRPRWTAYPPGVARYKEDSGTSMAAPHVSGAVAAYISRNFNDFSSGKPRLLKDVFTGTATSLGRDRNFQGHGLVDLMRALQDS